MSSRVLLAKIKEFNQVMKAKYANELRSLHRSMVRNIKKTFLPKTGMWKSSLQDPGYVGVVGEMRAALLHACRIFVVVVGDVRDGSHSVS